MFAKKKFLIFIVAGIFIVSLFYVFWANAGSVTDFSDFLYNPQPSGQSNHLIEFTTPSGVSAGQTITLTFANEFTIGLVDYTDIDIMDDNVDLSLGAVASGATWGVAFSGQVLTITSGTGTIAAGSTVTVEIGTYATSQTTGDQQLINPAANGSYLITLAGTFADSGEAAVAIFDNEVGVTASVQAAQQQVSNTGDGVAPIITTIQQEEINNDTVIITWITDEASTSTVYYGEDEDYNTGSVADNTYTTHHEIILTDLEPGETYHFIVKSTDWAGNYSISFDEVFTTSQEGGPYLYLRAIPEKRLPDQGNNSTFLDVKIYQAGTDNLLLSEKIQTDSDGYSSEISLADLQLPLAVDFLIKGYSHLQYRKDNVLLQATKELIDFSEDDVVFLKAGDVNGENGDNYINGIDLSVLGNNIYTDDDRSDLNQDGIVNGLEFSIAITNLFNWGDF